MENSRKRETASAAWVLGIVKAQLIFWITGALFLLLFCRIACSMDDPSAVTRPLSLTALCLSALAGGFSAVRFTGDGLLSGLLSGTVSLLLLRAPALLSLPASGMESGTVLLFTVLVPVLSVCGAVLGRKRKHHSRHRHR